MSEPQPRRLENSIMRLALSSTEATLGKSGYHAVTRLAGLDRLLETPPPDNTKLETPGDDMSALLNAILNMYGESSSRGLFRRWGTAFGTTIMKRRPSAKLLKPMLAVLPLQRRVHTVLDALVREANNARGAELHTLHVTPDQHVLTFNDCLHCTGMHPAEPICFTIVGILEAALQWGTGRDFTVREVQCHARGAAACVFAIDTQPLHV